MIVCKIDFIGGSHGNFLEFVLNKLVLGDKLEQDSPFNRLGASHYKDLQYTELSIFEANHFFLEGILDFSKIISINFNEDDLLPLTSISLQRAGDYNILDTELHIETFNKLNNVHYRPTLMNILNYYNDLSGYQKIKADTWPLISSIDEFYDLPAEIIIECKEVFDFAPKIINEKNPNIDRYKLREFFKFGFKHPEQHGFMQEQQRMQYASKSQVFYFPYSSFYNLIEFKKQLNKIKNKFNFKFFNYNIDKLHVEFMKRQPFYNLKKITDQIINEIFFGGTDRPLHLTLFQESYINAKLELIYNCEMPFRQLEYFKTTKEISNFIHEI